MSGVGARVRELVRRGRATTAHVSWTVVDQGVSALTNLLVSIMVARSASAEGFGAFAVTFIVYGVVLGLSRSLIGQPLQISFASASRGDLDVAVGRALGASVLVGSAAGVLSAGTGLVIGGQVGAALLALSVWFPALILQDTCRMAFFCAAAPQRAVVIDVIWGVLVLGGFPLAVATGGADNIAVLLTFWGAGAGVSALVGMVLLRSRAPIRGAITWMRERRDLSRYLSLEYLLTMGIAQAGILAVGVVGTQAGVGAIRAGYVLLGPTNVVGTAAMIFTTTEVARRPAATARQRATFAGAVSGALALGIGAYVALLLVLPDTVGEHLLGDTWTGAKSVLLPMCITAVASALCAGVVGTMYGMGLAKKTLSINVYGAVLNIVLFTVGIWHWGAVGAAWALAITEIVLIPFWILGLRAALRDHENHPPADRSAQPPHVQPEVLGAP